MEPVVNGLEKDFGADVEFRRIDANSTDGQVLFRTLKLRGHPSYVILNPDADLLWFGIGEQTEVFLAGKIRQVLSE